MVKLQKTGGSLVNSLEEGGVGSVVCLVGSVNAIISTCTRFKPLAAYLPEPSMSSHNLRMLQRSLCVLHRLRWPELDRAVISASLARLHGVCRGREEEGQKKVRVPGGLCPPGSATLFEPCLTV